MNYQLSFLTEIEHDIQEAYDWYEDKLPGLGEDFLLSIDNKLSSLIKDPYLFAKIYKDVRKVKIQKFPFSIFYVIDNNTISIIAIMHMARHPKNWKSRNR